MISINNTINWRASQKRQEGGTNLVFSGERNVCRNNYLWSVPLVIVHTSADAALRPSHALEVLHV